MSSGISQTELHTPRGVEHAFDFPPQLDSNFGHDAFARDPAFDLNRSLRAPNEALAEAPFGMAATSGYPGDDLIHRFRPQRTDETLFGQINKCNYVQSNKS
jgi:hypothetical protein